MRLWTRRVEPRNFVKQRNCLGPPPGVAIIPGREEQRLLPLPDGERGRGPWGRCGGKPGGRVLALAAVLIFLAAAAWARVVATDLFRRARRGAGSAHSACSRVIVGDCTALQEKARSPRRELSRIKVGMPPLSRRPLTAPRQARGRRSRRSSEAPASAGQRHWSPSASLDAFAWIRPRSAVDFDAQNPAQEGGSEALKSIARPRRRGAPKREVCVNPIAHTGGEGRARADPITARNASCIQRRGPIR